MSIQAPQPPRHQEQQQTTAKLESVPCEPIIDALPLLDYRTRMRAISPRLAPRGHYLELQDGDQWPYVPLEERITHVGRGFTADVRFEQPHVSVDHAILVRHGRYVRLLDNRSSNGTFVNGRPIITTNLQDGDVLRVGPVVMRYVVVSWGRPQR